MFFCGWFDVFVDFDCSDWFLELFVVVCDFWCDGFFWLFCSGNFEWLVVLGFYFVGVCVFDFFCCSGLGGVWFLGMCGVCYGGGFG